MKRNINKALKEALLKKALGYTSTEIIEEYTNGEDGMVLQKKKITSKDIPPDPQSFKALLEIDDTKANEFDSFSDEELIEEKTKLIRLIKQKDEKDESKR